MTFKNSINRMFFDYSACNPYFTPSFYYAYNNQNSFENIFSLGYKGASSTPQQSLNFNYPSIMMSNLSISTSTTPSLMMPSFTMPTLQLPPLQLSYQAPAFKFNMPNLFTTQTTPTQTTSSVQAATGYQYNANVTPPSGKYDLAWWKSQGYDETMGKKLAQDAVKTAVRDPGECAGYTRRTINRLYGTNFARAGKAKDFGNTFLAGSQLKGKFKKITVPGLKDSDIPEGAIVIWYPGRPGYTKGKAAVCGHIAIAHNGAGYANGVVQNLSTYSEIWIPVKA